MRLIIISMTKSGNCAAMVLVVRSEFIAILPRAAVQAMKGQVELVTVRPPFPLAGFAYDLVWHKRLDGDPASSGFVNCFNDVPSKLRRQGSADCPPGTLHRVFRWWYVQSWEKQVTIPEQQHKLPNDCVRGLTGRSAQRQLLVCRTKIVDAGQTPHIRLPVWLADWRRFRQTAFRSWEPRRR